MELSYREDETNKLHRHRFSGLYALRITSEDDSQEIASCVKYDYIAFRGVISTSTTYPGTINIP